MEMHVSSRLKTVSIIDCNYHVFELEGRAKNVLQEGINYSSAIEKLLHCSSSSEIKKMKDSKAFFRVTIRHYLDMHGIGNVFDVIQTQIETSLDFITKKTRDCYRRLNRLLKITSKIFS